MMEETAIFSRLRLGMFYRALVSKGRNGYTIWPVYAKLVEKLAQYFDHILLVEPTSHISLPKSTHKITKDNISVFELPYFQHADDFLKVAPATISRLESAIRQVDIVYIRIPLPSAFFIWREAKRQKKMVVLHVVGDLRKQYSRERPLLNRWVARIGVECFELMNQFIINKSLTITQGRGLEAKHKRPGNRVYEITRVPLEDREIVHYRDTCKHDKIKLLWIGNVHARKGLRDLINAVKICRRSGHNVYLDLIGEGDDKLKRKLQELIRSLQLSNTVRFVGFVPHGKNLFHYYDYSDIFVYPTYGEGFPRVVLESMARALPVITTRVGGIPELVRHEENGILINPGRPSEIGEAIQRMIKDDSLRRKLIASGLSTARKYKLDNFCRKFLTLVARHYDFLPEKSG